MIQVFTNAPEMGESLEQQVDEDIAQFSEYFRSLNSSPLTTYERSTIKSYLHWKTHGEPSPTPSPTAAEGTNAT